MKKRVPPSSLSEGRKALVAPRLAVKAAGPNKNNRYREVDKVATNEARHSGQIGPNSFIPEVVPRSEHTRHENDDMHPVWWREDPKEGSVSNHNTRSRFRNSPSRTPEQTTKPENKSTKQVEVKAMVMQTDRLKRRICFDSVTGRRVTCPVREDPETGKKEDRKRGKVSNRTKAPPPINQRQRKVQGDDYNSSGGGGASSQVDLQFLIQRMMDLMRAAHFIDVTLKDLISGLSRFPEGELQALRNRLGTDHDQEQMIEELITQVLSSPEGEDVVAEDSPPEPEPPTLQDREFHQ